MPGLYAQFTQKRRLVLHDCAHLGLASSTFAQRAPTHRRMRTFVTFLEQEIATQPDDWARVVQRLPEVADLLPRPGERVATIGCGTSWFMGQAYAVLRESLGQGVTDAFAAS